MPWGGNRLRRGGRTTESAPQQRRIKSSSTGTPTPGISSRNTKPRLHKTIPTKQKVHSENDTWALTSVFRTLELVCVLVFDLRVRRIGTVKRNRSFVLLDPEFRRLSRVAVYSWEAVVFHLREGRIGLRLFRKDPRNQSVHNNCSVPRLQDCH